MAEKEFPKNPKLETTRLILRKPKRSDWKDLVEGLDDIDVTKQLAHVPNPYKKKDALNFIQKARKNYKKKKGYPFFIELKKEKKVIGCIGLDNIKKFDGVVGTGSWINKKYGGNGYITEAKIAANDFAFNKLGLRRLESEVYPNNTASNKTQKRMGYKYEGTKRKSVKCKATGKMHDSNIYGLLKEDWKKARKKVKKHLENKIKKLNKPPKK